MINKLKNGINIVEYQAMRYSTMPWISDFVTCSVFSYLYWQPVASPFVYSLPVVPSSLWLSFQKLKKND